MKKISAIFLTAALSLSLFAGCQNVKPTDAPSKGTEAQTPAPTEATTEATTAAPTEAPTEAPSEPDKTLEINVAVLSGATGWSAVKILDDVAAGTASLNYKVSIESSPKVIQDSLIAGTLDIAALPTNKAALIANATGGKIQVAAVNTLGVLHLVTADGTEIKSLDELSGKKVCIPQEPSYILTALLEKAGVQNVEVETYATPSDLVTGVVKGEVAVAVLPEPLMSTVMSKKDTVKACLNLTDLWENYFPACRLMQGCIVFRTAWAEAHPVEAKAFLDDLKASVELFRDGDADAVATSIETHFGVAAGVAKKARPNVAVTFVAGEEMKKELTCFYSVLASIPTAGIGDKAPAEDFYFDFK